MKKCENWNKRNDMEQLDDVQTDRQTDWLIDGWTKRQLNNPKQKYVDNGNEDDDDKDKNVNQQNEPEKGYRCGWGHWVLMCVTKGVKLP